MPNLVPNPPEPLVSVVVATYNMGQYLPQAVDSVLGQTVGDLDVHVVDDGSSDDTRAIMQRYSADARVHYHWQHNAGQTRAKNAGVRASRGRYVAFCDADDLWLPGKLAVQLPLFERNPAVGVVYSRNQPISASGERIAEREHGPFYSGRVTEQLFKRNFISFGTAVVRRACLEECGAFDERYRMGIDWDLWLRISTRHEIGFVDQVTYLYRVWPGQMSNNWRGRYEAAFGIMQDFLERNPDVLPARVVREAYADCYTERARLRSLLSGEYAQGLADACRAIRFMPSYIPAWKVIARIAATALTPSRAQTRTA